MTLVRPLTLLASSNAKWTTTQEKTIARDYPFIDIHLETPDQFVVRTYLQFLWLPESIMPIHLLVPSLHRVQDASPGPADTPHPLHALLEPLLLSVRSVAEKYHSELPHILAQEDGEGGAEESVMWYALEYENNEVEEENANASTENAVMLEEKSRNMWFERLERREVQIQILLYLVKLSLPGPCTPLPPVTIPVNDGVFASKKRSKKRVKVVIPTAQERLESFMDKLSVWQLVINVNNSSKRSKKDEHDWMRAFCENVVERQFKSTLPDTCALLRHKLFPHSPFEDEDDESGARSSPASQVADPVPSRPRPRKLTRSSTSASISESKDKLNPKPLQRSSSNIPDARSRSRSLSVSLAQDASARRSNTVSGLSSLKRALNREVSMSRGFKPRVRRSGTLTRKVPAKTTMEAKKEDKHSRGVTLVAATPTKPRVRRDLGDHRQVTGQSRSQALSPDPEGEGGMSDDLGNGSDGGEESGALWLADSSPDLLRGARKRTASGSSSSMGYPDPSEEGMDTPVKKRLRM